MGTLISWVTLVKLVCLSGPQHPWIWSEGNALNPRISSNPGFHAFLFHLQTQHCHPRLAEITGRGLCLAPPSSLELSKRSTMHWILSAAASFSLPTGPGIILLNERMNDLKEWRVLTAPEQKSLQPGSFNYWSPHSLVSMLNNKRSCWNEIPCTTSGE